MIRKKTTKNSPKKTGVSKKTAVLALESGRTYFGNSFGAEGERYGEVVFNTSMTGYQEILTDPSYKGQIIIMTEPHIGNVGVNTEDQESRKTFCEGLVVREASQTISSWRAEESLQDFLKARALPAVTGIDTRALTKHIRQAGAMRGVLSTVDLNPKSLLKKIIKSPEMTGRDLVKDVTSKRPYKWQNAEWEWGKRSSPRSEAEWGEPTRSSQTGGVQTAMRVVVMDFGIKQNILRCLVGRNCRVTVVPAQTPYKEILALKPDGIMLSNGPGDPAAVTYGIKTVQNLISAIQGEGAAIPIFGICLGHQILGLAMGGKTYKLKFGHRGANHPVKDMTTGKIEITTQNHGFAVDTDSLSGKQLNLTHINLNDQTLEGMQHKTLPIFSVQYHPESSAGPHDSRYLFDRFTKKIQTYKSRKKS